MVSYGMMQDVPQQLPEADLPGGFAVFLRAFFSVPQGVQMAGGILAALVGLTLVVLAVRKRDALLAWWSSRTRPLQIGLTAGAAIVLVFVVSGSVVSWDYMQHDNDFCTGCHVMGPAYQRFTESGHSELSCHDCHQQSIFASTRQLHLWIKDRPEEIGEHSPVPTQVCAECHIASDPADNWRQIAATAGHVAHLESDSSALADVQCVTCHGQEVHQFRPADQTCGQVGCHEADATEIVLGAMTEETGLHCVTCHEFTAERAMLASIDSVAGPLTPGLRQCTSCHEMETLWADYDPAADPHDARCGACHNPHEQENPELALKSCTGAGCHSRPDTLTTFHVGLPQDVTEDCTSCHLPHVWERDGDDCGSCHTDIPGATAAASRTVAAATTSASPAPHPVVTLAASEGAPQTALQYLHADATAAPAAFEMPQQVSFGHAEHTSVACTECHSNRSQHGEVTVRTQSDCFSCHHSTNTAQVQGCGSCHGEVELGRVRQVTTMLELSVGEGRRPRALPFDHDAHTELRCVDCHGGGIRQSVQTSCAACHEDHHRPEATASCASCHAEYRTPVHTADVHTRGCTGSGCHSEPRYSRMDRTREFCATCHQDMIEHEPGQPCMNCHLVPTTGSSG
ncbi:MAG TPA: hypothetical protein VLA33_00960 [Gemmatimonadota bacterium]|nr:hypothetical protein [Gemmatimonadota bacterium]